MKANSIVTMVVLASAATVYGHGDQVQITYNATTGRIETREIVHTASRPNAISDLKRVYVMPMLELQGGAGNGWYTRPNDARDIFNNPLYPTGPGINFQYESQLTGTGWSFSGSGSLPNLQASNFAYAIMDGVKEWNGATYADPGAEQIQLFRGDGTSVPSIMTNTTDSGPFGTLAMGTINSQSSNAHSSIGYRMLGDGVNFGLVGAPAGDDGVYLLSLSLTSTAAGVQPSDTFYYVMFKNASLNTAMDAAMALGFDSSLIQVMPEPTALAILVFAAALSRGRRRR